MTEVRKGLMRGNSKRSEIALTSSYSLRLNDHDSRVVYSYSLTELVTVSVTLLHLLLVLLSLVSYTYS